MIVNEANDWQLFLLLPSAMSALPSLSMTKSTPPLWKGASANANPRGSPCDTSFCAEGYPFSSLALPKDAIFNCVSGIPLT